MFELSFQHFERLSLGDSVSVGYSSGLIARILWNCRHLQAIYDPCAKSKPQFLIDQLIILSDKDLC